MCLGAIVLCRSREVFVRALLRAKAEGELHVVRGSSERMPLDIQETDSISGFSLSRMINHG